MADIRFKIILLALITLLPQMGLTQDTHTHVKCGFGIHQEPPPQFSIYGTQQTTRPDYLGRNNRYLVSIDDTYHFLLHYDVTGTHAVPGAQTISTEAPDYIIAAEEALRKAWHILASPDSFGFDIPPMDNVGYPEDPPGGAWDIYFSNQNFYGWTQPEDQVESTQQPNDYTGYIEIENDFAGFLTTGLPAVRVTTAHELFHLFHLGYAFKTDDLWWYELTASWFEDLTYPEVNDYVYYVESYFEDPRPINQGGFERLPGYRSAHYGFILSDYEEPALMENIWDIFRSERAYQAIDEGLQSIGSSFLDSYLKFAGWNLATGQNAVNGFGYPDAGVFPEIDFRTDKVLSLPDSLPFSIKTQPRDIAYIQVSQASASESDFELNNISSGGATALGTSLGLYGMLDNFKTAGIGQSYSFGLGTAGVNGLIAIVNAGSDTSTLSIQRINVLKTYPNPYVLSELSSPLNLFVILGNESQLNLQVYDLLGRRLYQSNLGGTVFPGGRNTIPIQIENSPLVEVSSGVYFIRLQGENYNETAKITILR
jgi:hypothetical protein